MKASAIVRNLTVVLAVASMLSGIFIVELLALSKVQVPRVVMLQWALILGMPLLLLVSFLSFNRQPAQNAAMATTCHKRGLCRTTFIRRAYSSYGHNWAPYLSERRGRIRHE